MKLIKLLLGNEYSQGGVILTISSLLGSFMNYIFNLLAARGLGPSGYGEITTLNSYVAILSAPISVFTTMIIQKIGSKGKDRLIYSKALESWFFSATKRWWFLFLPLTILIPFSPSITNLHPFTAYSIFILLFISIFVSLYGAIFQGMRLFLPFAIFSIAVTFVKLLGGVFVILNIDGINTILFFLIASALFSLFLYKKKMNSLHIKKDKKLKIEKRIIEVILSQNFIITTLSVVGITFLSNLDVVYVKKIFTPAEAGIYGSWSLLSKIILFGIGPALSVLFIFFSESKNQTNQRKVFSLSLLSFFIIGLISFIFYSYFSNFLTTILFGNKYQKLLPYFSHAAVFGSLYASLTFLFQYYLAKQRIESLIVPFSIPFYIGALFIFSRNLISVMNINIIYAGVLNLIYILLYFFRSSKKKALVEDF